MSQRSQSPAGGTWAGPVAVVVSILSILVLGASVGCATRGLHWTLTPALKSSAAKVVVVYPFEFRWTEPAWRSYQKSRDLVHAALDQGELLVVGPEEFTVRRPASPNVLASSTLLPRLMELGLRPEDAIVLRAFAEDRREQFSRVILNNEGSQVGAARDERRKVLLHLQLISVKKGAVILELKQTVHFDPLASYPDTDPLLPLTTALKARVEEALDKLESVAKLPKLGAKLVVNPASQLPSLAPGGDPLAGELSALGFWAYFEPDFGATPGPSLRRSLLAAGHGALVATLAGGVAAESGLKPGDLIVRCNDMTVTGPETVLRHLGVSESGVRLELLREGTRRTLWLKAP